MSLYLSFSTKKSTLERTCVSYTWRISFFLRKTRIQSSLHSNSPWNDIWPLPFWISVHTVQRCISLQWMSRFFPSGLWVWQEWNQLLGSRSQGIYLAWEGRSTIGKILFLLLTKLVGWKAGGKRGNLWPSGPCTQSKRGECKHCKL